MGHSPRGGPIDRLGGTIVCSPGRNRSVIVGLRYGREVENVPQRRLELWVLKRKTGDF
jgi:hypothetical protein